MKEQEKQIEEMAKDMGVSFQLAGTTRFGAVAEALIRFGWIKPDKDSVVLSKEEYEHLKAKSTRIPIDKDGNFIEYAVYDTDRVLSKPEYRDYIYEKGSKEMAEKILNKQYQECKTAEQDVLRARGNDKNDAYYKGFSLGMTNTKMHIKELAKSLGVEIKE